MQEKILQTASELFKNHGLKRVSIDEICQELHISKKTFYNYYTSKEDLVDAMLTHACEYAHRKKQNRMKTLDAMDILLNIMRHVQDIMPEQAPTPIWYDLYKYYPSIAQKHEEIGKKKIQEGLSSFIEKGKAEGIIREDLNADIFTIFMYPIQIQLRDFFEKGGVDYNGHHYTSRELSAYCLDAFARVILSEKGKEEFQKRTKIN